MNSRRHARVHMTNWCAKWRWTRSDVQRQSVENKFERMKIVRFHDRTTQKIEVISTHPKHLLALNLSLGRTFCAKTHCKRLQVFCSWHPFGSRAAGLAGDSGRAVKMTTSCSQPFFQKLILVKTARRVTEHFNRNVEVTALTSDCHHLRARMLDRSTWSFKVQHWGGEWI